MVYKDNPHQGEWQSGMMETCVKAPLAWIQHCILPCCCAYQHRETLIGDGEYYCCGGMCPICCLKDPCPRVPCLCLEVFCCPFNAIMVNRYMVQDRKQLKNECCDECLITTAILCGCIRCILNILGFDVGDEISLAVDIFICLVMGCMGTQTAIELGMVSGFDGMNTAAPANQKMY